ncbi:EamA family transporter [Arthrobacter mangrovi]|uniref:Membrane protein n=1 Tax=Arthrobacter mangrovi TaxID=2966350 RepID=A0ABQ5MZ94_9MICC|nr:EamA family transporter [Arthrobacter mangrovi]GLB69281.1 membrane protein [Arthrobacter mangrovi]
MEQNESFARGRRTGVATLMGSALSNQLGAASGSQAFPVLGPVGVVAVRQLIAAAVLVPVVRPRLRSFTGGQWWPVLLLALVFGTMNLGLYAAVERIGLGLAMTLEFVGPLAVAILGARHWKAKACAFPAAAGVLAITQPGPSTDYLGIMLALTAAGCWAAYIMLNKTVGARIPGVQGTAAAAAVSATLFLPVAVIVFATQRPDGATLLYAAGAGILATVVPYTADLLVLRRFPANLFGILMSINPVFAALVGVFVLDETLNAVHWLGIALIVGANAAALGLRDGRSTAGRP